jgi:energy-coupling factor transporter ATP-binding protein EcfA2
MRVESIKFQGHRCFKNDWAGFEAIKPINVIIGRNNTGKSHLLDLAEALCKNTLKGRGWRFSCRGTLEEGYLRQVFPAGTSGGQLGGDFWHDHGRFFVGVNVMWKADEQFNPSDISFPGFDPSSPHGEGSSKSRIVEISRLLAELNHKLTASSFRRLLADRDVHPEKPQTQLALEPDGHGATNIVRRYIVTSNTKYPREVIQRDLLAGLNKIFGQDGQFDEIQVKLHDESNAGSSQDHWEIFLGEKKKGGLIPLSSSGSGLKTVLLVLLNLLVIPEIEGKSKSKFTFAFEELENNLHPALLRRLFQFIENFAVKEQATVFLTTHSSTALDLFGVSKNAQIIHVTHDGEVARAAAVSAHFDHLGVISELGAKPSDLLQANGIIWVEGPSDCIYLNRWIDLLSDGKLQEGRDYQCAFYGGSLLARTQFASPEEAEAELVNLFRVNPNIIVVCDGDRTAATGEGSRIKERVRRINAEVNKIPNAHIWVTEAKEIENYLPGAVLGKVFELADVPDPSQFEAFFPSEDASKKGSSFVESHLNCKGVDKMDLAVQAAPHITKAMLDSRFDLVDQISQIIEKIRHWNE